MDELGSSCSDALANALAHAFVHALEVKIAFRSTAATLQIALVLIIVHKGTADPLLPSLSARVAVADMGIGENQNFDGGKSQSSCCCV